MTWEGMNRAMLIFDFQRFLPKESGLAWQLRDWMVGYRTQPKESLNVDSDPKPCLKNRVPRMAQPVRLSQKCGCHRWDRWYPNSVLGLVMPNSL